MDELNELTLSLLCFNVDKKDSSNCTNYLKKANADLYLLQEVGSTCILISGEKLHLREEGTNPLYNSIAYNTSKFEVLVCYKIACAIHEGSEYKKILILNEFIKKLTENQCTNLEKRVCLAILQCKGSSTWRPRIIVASFHNPHSLGEDHDEDQSPVHVKLAEQFFKAVDYIGRVTEYPVVVAGDFNCELLKKKVNTHGFIIPKYDPTIHRASTGAKSDPCIDFFAYKNYNACTKIEVTDVQAELVIPPSADGQYLDDKEHCESIIMKNAAISNHDPLRATLTVKTMPTCTLTISIIYYRGQTKITSTSDLVILHKINESQQLTLPGYKRMETFNSTRLYYKEGKFCCFKNPIVHLNSLKIFYLDLYQCRKKRGLKSIFAFATKSGDNEQEHFIKLLNQWRLEKNCDTAIVMGDFKLPAGLPFVSKEYDLPTHGDKCFIAYLSVEHMYGAVVAQFNSCIVENTLVFQKKKYQASLNYKFVDFRINALCFNMEGAHNDNSYFTNLNPKPDILILQKFQGPLDRDEQTCNACNSLESQPAIVYNKDLFQFVNPVNLTKPEITACIIKCLRIVGNPEIIVASLDNSTGSIDNVVECLESLHAYSHKHNHKYLILIAGGFNVELNALQTQLQNNNYGFTISRCDMTILRKLTVACKAECTENTCKDFFVYKSCDTSIKLENVYAEAICPGLVTGSSGYNIDYDQLQKIRSSLGTTMIAKHDPIRAKLTIKPLQMIMPSQARIRKSWSLSNLSSTPPNSSTPNNSSKIPRFQRRPSYESDIDDTGDYLNWMLTRYQLCMPITL